jgi:ribonuclease G
VGSIFKGKVRNLEDGLKAAFVDIGFEKNAFLHYWDIVPTAFDSGVEVVERRKQTARPPAHHAKGHPAPYPPGSEIIVQVTKGPIGTKGPRVTTNLTLPGRYLVLLPNSEQSGISRKIENRRSASASKASCAKSTFPKAWASSCAPPAKGSKALFHPRPGVAAGAMEAEIQEKIKTQPPAPAFSRSRT